MGRARSPEEPGVPPIWALGRFVALVAGKPTAFIELSRGVPEDAIDIGVRGFPWTVSPDLEPDDWGMLCCKVRPA